MSSQNSASLKQQIELSFVSEVEEVVADIQKHFALMAHIKAPLYVTDERRSRAPVTISAVLDRSGSMQGSKLTLVKKTMEFVIQNMKPEDQLGIITFDSLVKVDLPVTKMTEEGKSKAILAIKDIKDGGSTNLSGGLFAGIKQVTEAISEIQKQSAETHPQQADQSSTPTLSPEPQCTSSTSPAPTSTESCPTTSSSSSSSSAVVASVWVFTDGLANQGIQDSAILKAETEALLAKVSSSCSLFTFGFGSDHNSALLTDISKVGNGLYYYVETEDKIPDAFTDCLGGLLTVTAQNLHLTLTPGEVNHGPWAPWTKSLAQHSLESSKCQCKILKVQTAFKHEVDPISGVATVHVPDIYSEEARDIVLQLEVPALHNPSEFPVAMLTLALTYFNVVTCHQEEVSCVVYMPRPAISTELSYKPIPVELSKQKNRLLCTEALITANQLSEKKNMTQAREVLKKAIDNIRASVTGSDPFCQALIADLQECSGKLRDHSTYTTCGSHTLNWMTCSHSYQRSGGRIHDSYTTSFKCTMSGNYRSSN